VPLLNFYPDDDSLVPPFEASMMARYERGATLKRTLLVKRGEHAYFFDRWWQQKAILDYFRAMLPGAAGNRHISAKATVNETPGGSSFGSQLVTLGHPTRKSADKELAPYVCNTKRGSPGASSASSG
jgi:hypothetical protein